MRSPLIGIMAEQEGAFARHQALACGYSEREFVRLTRRTTGEWIRIRYGVYTTREHWSHLDELGRAKLADRAALLVCADDTVLSHNAAARRLALPLYDVNDGLTHVNRTGAGQTGRIQAGINHHRGVLDPAEVMRPDDGIPITTPARTALDIAAEFGYRSGLVTADAALRMPRVDVKEMRELAERMASAPASPTVRAVAEQADGRAETPIETLGRITLVNMGISDLVPQYSIALPGGGTAITDLYSPELNHVFECDGRIKYRNGYDDLGSWVSAEEVLWSEKKREDGVRGLGYGFSRLVWADVLEQNFARTSTRLWREIRQQHTSPSALRPAS